MAEFKKGDKVRFVNTPNARQHHDNAPQFYPLPGTVGTVYQYAAIPRNIPGEIRVQWPDGSVKGPDHIWWVLSDLLERVEDAAPDYYIRVTATSEHGAQVEVNGPADWVHEALAQAIMKLNPEDPFSVLAAVLSRALDVEDGDDDE